MEGKVNFKIVVELYKYRNHSIKCKTLKPRVADARKLGMRHACQFFGLAGGKPTLVRYANDLGCKNGAGLLNAGVSAAKVTKRIAAAANGFIPCSWQ
ncbi:MAG TPA: hypothetical protein VEF34_12500 [Syntrophobacteraceae bacterium]|nr:hypothetical protein [Syntrophobacteraceae bacterium]